MQSMKDLKRFSKEWWKNFIFYYKWHVIIGIAVIGLIGGTIYSSVTKITPDLYVLFSGDYVLMEDDAALLKARMEEAISDINNDGKRTARLLEIPLKLNSEQMDETTAASNLQMQTQFLTGEQHILVLDRELFNLYNARELLDTNTLCVETKDCALFEGTSLAQRDAIMVTRVKRHDYESDFTTSQQLIDYWVKQ